MIFKDNTFKSFRLSDLVGRNLDVKSSGENGLVLIMASDTRTGECFVLSETQYKDGEPCFHYGCMQHSTRACEVCGRVVGKSQLLTIA